MGLFVSIIILETLCPPANKFLSWKQLGRQLSTVPNEGGSHARRCTGHSRACGFIQTWSPSPSQSISKDAGPYGLSVFGTSVGPASHAAPSVLAETLSSSPHLASQTPLCQGEPGLCCSSGPLEKTSVDGTGRGPGQTEPGSRHAVSEQCPLR